MTEVASQALKSNEIASVVGNMLKLAFFDNSRDNAKRSYLDLQSGKRLRLPALAIEKDARIDVLLSMDTSECQGKLGFSSFKKHLAAVLGRISQEMEAGDVPLLASEDGKQRVINLPVAFKSGEDVNVLALGFELRTGELEIKVMYLPPNQFTKQAQSAP